MIREGDVQIGKLRDRITIERPVRTDHPQTGESIISWEVVQANVPAMIETLQTEQEKSAKQSRINRHSIAIRFRDDFQGETQYRVIVDGEPCEVNSAVDLGRRRRFLLLSVTGVK